MESSPAIGAGIIPNGSFLEMRLRALDTYGTFAFTESGYSNLLIGSLA